MSQGSLDGDVPQVISQVLNCPTLSLFCSIGGTQPCWRIALVCSWNRSSMELPSLARKAGCPTAEMHVCQLMLQAQAKLWEGLSCMAEHLDNLNAVIRELVVRRYKPADIKRIEAGEYGDVDDIPADEDPEFQLQYQKNRYAYTRCLKLHAVTQEVIETSREFNRSICH